MHALHKLLFVKLGTLYCVWSYCGHPRLYVPWFWCKMCLMFEFAWLDWYSIDAQSIKTENFSIFKYLTNLFFFASFVFRIHMHCIVFYIHLAVLQSYLSLFSHITCIHFAKLGTQLDLKIDWLIFESFVHSSICYFYVNCRKLFS